MEFVEALAEASATRQYGPARAAAAIIGHADLNLGGRVEPVLEALRAASPNRFRGIRFCCSWDPHAEVEDRAPEGQLSSAIFREGALVLARLGLVLENTVFFPQLPELTEFAKAVPDLTIISNHIGGLMRVGPYANGDEEVLAMWRGGIAAVAECPTVVMKLGGVGGPRYGFGWHTRETPICTQYPIGIKEYLTLLSGCHDQVGLVPFLRGD